jgi:hypothetical protein
MEETRQTICGALVLPLRTARGEEMGSCHSRAGVLGYTGIYRIVAYGLSLVSVIDIPVLRPTRVTWKRDYAIQ